MHIVFFTINMEKDGAERVISNLCNQHLIKKYKVSIVTYLPLVCRYELDKKINVYSLMVLQNKSPVWKFLEMKYVNKRYMSLMHDINPDVVVAFLPRPCMVACAMRKKLGVPVIGSIRSNPEVNFKNPIYRMIAKSTFDQADGFVFQTKQARDFFHKKLQKKSKIIMNPVNAEAVRVQYSGIRSKRIVSVGRFTEEKNYPLLLQAFAGLAPVYSEYVLWIYGKYDEKLSIRELADHLKIADRVVFAGQTDHLYDEIYDAGLFVLSSKSEGMPNALMEAMALGIPVIATDCPCGGPRSLIQNGVNGILVPNEDKKALTQAMEYMLSDSRRAARMAAKAQNIGVRYGGQQIYEAWENYIMKVVQKKLHDGDVKC